MKEWQMPGNKRDEKAETLAIRTLTETNHRSGNGDSANPGQINSGQIKLWAEKSRETDL